MHMFKQKVIKLLPYSFKVGDGQGAAVHGVLEESDTIERLNPTALIHSKYFKCDSESLQIQQ